MRLNSSGTAGSTACTDRGLSACVPPNEAQGVAKTVTSRRKRVLRRIETVIFMATPSRAPIAASMVAWASPLGEVDQIPMSHVQLRG
jgi:hypothetical protein